MDYWKACIEESLDDAGIDATNEQIEIITSWVEGAHENYGLATGQDAIPNPLEAEIKAFKKELVIMEASHQRQLDGVCKGIARKLDVDSQGVHISANGNVTYNY